MNEVKKEFNLDLYLTRMDAIKDSLLVTYPELAKMIGVSYATINRIKLGKRNVSQRVKRLIKEFVEEHE